MATLINIGIPLTMIQNVVYALPARRTLLISSAAIEASFLESTGFASLPNANIAPGVETALPFVRSTGVGTSIMVKTS